MYGWGSAVNWGECFQNCRRRYLLKDTEDGHEVEVDGENFLSPKDLKTIGFLDLMLEAGVVRFCMNAPSTASDPASE